jgi:multimeric flavodoxin WrbA
VVREMERGACRILCIAGSPRRNGNTDRALASLEEGVRSEGGIVDHLVAATAGANPCRGCNACSADGVCIQRDGMDDVYARMDAADGIAIATPVFFATVPAVLKILYDRFQPYWARRYVLGEPPPSVKRPAALLLVGGGGDPFGSECAKAPTKSILAVLGVELIATAEATADRAREIEENPEMLAEASTIGAQLSAEATRRKALRSSA